jgi:hypothetical protein
VRSARIIIAESGDWNFGLSLRLQRSITSVSRSKSLDRIGIELSLVTRSMLAGDCSCLVLVGFDRPGSIDRLALQKTFAQQRFFRIRFLAVSNAI